MLTDALQSDRFAAPMARTWKAYMVIGVSPLILNFSVHHVDHRRRAGNAVLKRGVLHLIAARVKYDIEATTA